MTPIHFGDSFGWLHLPPPIEIAASGKTAAKPRSRAVVLCASVGREATALHRPWLLLAEQIAAAGMPVLRFDYPGIGDSVRDEGDPVALTDWVASIVAAAAWVKEQTDATEVALCGIRAGAALALAAAPAIEGLSRLALLAPAASWPRFLREQELMAGVSDTMWMVQHPIDRDGWWEASGLRLSQAMMDEARRADPLRIDRQLCERALILASEDSRSDRRLADRLRQVGTETELEAFPGRAGLMHDDLENVVPANAFARVTAWLQDGAPEMSRMTRPVLPSCTMMLPGARETAVKFGPDQRLFGIFCAPRDCAPRAAVMIFNTGAIPHYGQSRLAVTFARRLARRGIASLRMDASGLGDASPRSGHERPLFSETWLDEARHATDWLRNHVDAMLVLFGVCSGGYAALHLACGDPSVRGVLAANMQHFIHDETTPLRVQQRSTRSLRHYGRRLHSPALWQRLLRGGIPVANLIRSAAKTARERIGSPEQRQHRRVVARWFEHLEQRGVAVQIAYGPFDAGLDDLEKHFGPEGRNLKNFSNVVLTVVPDADHAFSHHPDREQLFQLLMDLIGNRVTDEKDRNRDRLAALEAAD